MGFFIWPMIVPIIIPLLYSIFYKKKILKDIGIITLIMIVIIALYEPLVWRVEIPYVGYTLWKFVLFVFIPIGIFYLYWKRPPVKKILARFGVKKRGWKLSLKYCALLLPVMLITWAIVTFLRGDAAHRPAEAWYSGIMFFESFTEEFFFRGILFLYLWKLTDIRIAYITSTLSFVLLHPQYFCGLGLIPAFTQGILTAVIVHKSKNLTGAWVLHGATRVVSMSLLPLLM